MGEMSGGLPCSFNSMCVCRTSTNSSQDSVSCLAVPLSRLPDLPSWSESVDVLESGLEVVDQDSLVLPLLVSLRLASNRILLIQDKAFLSTKALRSLDLSYNRLQEVPLEALRHMRSLEWLNLHGNEISVTEADWGLTGSGLTHLFLGENSLVELSLEEFRRLSSLSLEGNRLRCLGSLPTSLRTLSLSHNLFKEFPSSLQSLQALSWLYLRDNFIEHLRGKSLPKRVVDKLDLGQNFLSSFQLESNNNTVIRDLNLDFNNFKTLSESAFRGFSINRISLSRNRLESVNERAFDNLANSLEYLDLGGNRLQKLPRALSSLNILKYLYMPSNNVSDIQSDALSSFSESLGALSLSGNKLESIPKAALRKCRHMAHLNLGYNSIREVKEEDFADWGERLDTLLLMNNRIVELQENVFKHTPQLGELSLSFNKIASVHPMAFSGVNLESLEISFGLYQEEFPEEFLRPLTSLMWLALDNNEFRTISENSLSNLTSLRYLNLDGNRLQELPSNVFRSEIHSHLRDIRISDNHLESIETNTFSGLGELQSIVLERNFIRSIKSKAFCDLRSKISIYLSDNRISFIETAAFDGIPFLNKLDLHYNVLQELSLDIFNNCTLDVFPMSLNLSRNVLNSLKIGESWNPIHIKSIDLSHNLLNEVPREVFEVMRSSLRRIHLGYNHISKLDEEAFGLLSNLEALALEHNEIIRLRKRAFAGLHRLQILDLSHNHIEQLHMEQFKHLSNLRVMDLSNNHLRSVPRDAFQNTKLERIDLSSNMFLVMPSGALGEVGYTLRILDLSKNQIEHLDSTMFPETPHLTGLSLARNRISLVPDNVFTSLSGLLWLDLSGNRLQANFKELFHYLQSLRELNLGETGLKSSPVLPLPHLVSLNLSHNDLSELPWETASALPSLRQLRLSHCRFPQLPTVAVWAKLPRLNHLDISFNPIKELTSESLSGLDKLSSLEMTGLDSLERLEEPVSLVSLRSLSADTGPGLSSLLAPLTGLTSLSLRVLQPKLRHIPNLPAKVNHLQFTGSALKEVEAGCLRGLRGEAVVAFRGTGVEELPLGLLSGLEAVPHLTLNLRDNQITSLCLAQVEAGCLRGLRCEAVVSFRGTGGEELPLGLLSGLEAVSHLTLDLSDNQITSLCLAQVEAGCLQGLHGEAVVSFRGTGVEELPLGLLSGLEAVPHLTLNLRDNQIISLCLAQVEAGCLRGLRCEAVVSFRGTGVEELPLGLLSGLEAVSHLTLDLSDNQITSLCLAQVEAGCLRGLRGEAMVAFRGTGVEELPLGLLSGLEAVPHLTLNLRDNQITSLCLAQVEAGCLRGLRCEAVVSFRGTGGEELPLGLLSGLEAVSHLTLDLSDNQITSLCLAQVEAGCLQGLHGEAVVSFRGTGVEELPLGLLSGLEAVPHLTLNLRDNQIISLCLAQVEAGCLRGLRCEAVVSFRGTGVEELPLGLLSGLEAVSHLTLDLRDNQITSLCLAQVEAGCLRGLRGEAVVSFRGTGVEELPLGLLSGLEAVSHLTLDLRDNRITSLSPDTFYLNLTPWQHVGTKLISGGLLLKDNPLVCDCSLVWLGHWLRRWLRESLLSHTADPETAGRLTGAAREAVCTDRAGRKVPLLDLRPDHLACQASALSPAARPIPVLSHLLAALLLLR